MIQRLCFVCDLEAAAPHTKTHGIHVYLPWIRLLLSDLSHVSHRVSIHRHEYLNFLSSTLSNRFHEASEPRMRILSAIYDELTSRIFIYGSQVIRVLKNLILE